MHGLTVDAESGEVVELARLVGRQCSGRANRPARGPLRDEVPGVDPAPRLRRAWDARGWAHARPDKVVPTDGTALAHRWVEELYGLGYRDPDRPPAALPGSIRSGSPSGGGAGPRRAVATVRARLGRRRSAWNAADVRGEVEQCGQLASSALSHAQARRRALPRRRRVSHDLGLLRRPGHVPAHRGDWATHWPRPPASSDHPVGDRGRRQGLVWGTPKT